MDTTSWATMLMQAQARPGSFQNSQHVQHGPLECSPTLPVTLTLQRVGQHARAFQRRVCALPQRRVHAMCCISNEHHPSAGQLAAPRQRAAIGDGRVQQLWCGALRHVGCTGWGGRGVGQGGLCGLATTRFPGGQSSKGVARHTRDNQHGQLLQHLTSVASCCSTCPSCG